MEPTVNGAEEVKHRLKHIGKQSLLSFVGVLRDEKGKAALLLVLLRLRMHVELNFKHVLN